MSAKGNPVALLVLKHTDEEWPAKLPVMRLNLAKTPLGIVRGLGFAKRFVALFSPDLIHSHTFPANIFARMLTLMLRTRGVAPRLVNTIHNVDEGGWHRMLIYRATDCVADQITAVSRAAADRFVRVHAVSARKMRVLTNGIDTEVFSPDRMRRKRMRIEMKAAKAFVWIAIGRLVPAKDYPNLLQAFDEVRIADPAVRLWIAGEGDLDAWRAAHPDAVESRGVEALGLRRDVAALLDAADGFVLSSAWEGMPLALAEAMAMEKIVVATDVGGVRELVGESGIIVPPRDSAALAASMVRAMTMGEMERRIMGRESRKRVAGHFSIAGKAEEWADLYTKLVYDKNS
jgi:glycosyltransferase involved in cell wall biosynthesis